MIYDLLVDKLNVLVNSVCVSFISTTMKVQLDTEIAIQMSKKKKWSN